MDSLSCRVTTLRAKIKQLRGCNAMQIMSRSGEVLSAVDDLVDLVAVLGVEFEKLNEEVQQWQRKNASR